jgi:hypothetical protein
MKPTLGVVVHLAQGSQGGLATMVGIYSSIILYNRKKNLIDERNAVPSFLQSKTPTSKNTLLFNVKKQRSSKVNRTTKQTPPAQPNPHHTHMTLPMYAANHAANLHTP